MDEDLIKVNEFTSLFHDVVTEEFVSEGKLGPDHPKSLNMKNAEDYRDKAEAKKKEDKDPGYRKEKDTDYMSNNISKNYKNTRYQDASKGRDIIRKNRNSAIKRHYTSADSEGDKKNRYIEGSNKYNKSKQNLDNARRSYNKVIKNDDNDYAAAVGHSYRKSSTGRGKPGKAKHEATSFLSDMDIL